MKNIGLPIGHKENEYRRAILPEDIKKMKHPEHLYFEEGYGKVMGLSDVDFIEAGSNIASRDVVLSKDIICDPKVGDAEYLDSLTEGQTIFGWVHATQNRQITDVLVNRKLTAYAWEHMYYKGRHVFWRNNELAGEAAVLHAFQCSGRMPYGTRVAVIGRGNTARGAIKVLNMLGAEVIQYDRHTEKLLREEIGNYDAIVNCILWDIRRHDHIVYKEDLLRMKRGSMIVDVSCDRNGGIETSIPTTIEEPTYFVNGILHYVVDHTPSLYFKTFTEDNSKVTFRFLDELIEQNLSQTLNDALIIQQGDIKDKEINVFQNR